MAKSGFSSRQEAEEYIRRLAQHGAYKTPYRFKDPNTGEVKWFVRELLKKRRDKGPRYEGKSDWVFCSDA